MIEVKVNARDVQRRLDRLIADIERPDLVKVARSELEDIERTLWATSGSSGRHGKWVDTDEGNTPLVVTGRLRRSLTVSSDGDAIWHVTPRGVQWGTRVPYAAMAVAGGRGRGRSTRRIIDITPADVDRVERAIEKHIDKAHGGNRR